MVMHNNRVIRCPEKPRAAGDLVGCGSVALTDPDDEGLVDCLNCGLWFYPQCAEYEDGTPVGEDPPPIKPLRRI